MLPIHPRSGQVMQVAIERVDRDAVEERMRLEMVKSISLGRDFHAKGVKMTPHKGVGQRFSLGFREKCAMASILQKTASFGEARTVSQFSWTTKQRA